MIVRELIERLQQENPEAEICLMGEYGIPGPVADIETGKELRWTEGTASVVDLIIFIGTSEDSDD